MYISRNISWHGNGYEQERSEVGSCRRLKVYHQLEKYYTFAERQATNRDTHFCRLYILQLLLYTTLTDTKNKRRRSASVYIPDFVALRSLKVAV